MKKGLMLILLGVAAMSAIAPASAQDDYTLFSRKAIRTITEEMVILRMHPAARPTGGRKSVSEQAAPNAAPRQIRVRLTGARMILPTESSRK